MEELSDVYLQMTINKSNPGEEDSNGNYIFEVEASNENLDLQNQIVQQKALTGSKEYFLTNGVISDDHLHKTRDEDGNVETHKDKIIGEPISVWTDGTKTFVKGKLYGNNKFAKEYINLLKAGSTRVKASVGGIMPKVHKNRDGSETVTSFMWNDLALTCSPVNWTVAPAKFAKSLTNVDFVKALSAGTGTDAAKFTDGRALQTEDTEKKLIDVQPENEIEKSEDEIIKECLIRIDTGELEKEKDIIDFLMESGLKEDKAREVLREFIQQGEEKMQKSSFFSTMKNIAKSLGKKDEGCKKSKDVEETKDDEIIDTEEIKDDEIVEKSDEDDSDDSDPLEKSIDEDEMIEVTEIFKSFQKSMESLQEENKALKEELEETQNSMIDFAKSMQSYLATPQERKSVVQKSIDTKVSNGYISVKPDTEDFKTFKNAITKAIHEKEIDPYKVTQLNGVFQKSMKGEKILKSDWNSICSIVNKFGK